MLTPTASEDDSGHDHALPATHVANAAYGSPGGATAFFLVHAIAGKGADLYKGSAFIAEVCDPLPRGEFVAFFLPVCRLFSATFVYLFQFPAYLAPGQFHGVFIFVEFYIHIQSLAFCVTVILHNQRLCSACAAYGCYFC